MMDTRNWLDKIADRVFSEDWDRISKWAGYITCILALIWMFCGFIPR